MNRLVLSCALVAFTSCGDPDPLNDGQILASATLSSPRLSGTSASRAVNAFVTAAGDLSSSMVLPLPSGGVNVTLSFPRGDSTVDNVAFYGSGGNWTTLDAMSPPTRRVLSTGPTRVDLSITGTAVDRETGDSTDFTLDLLLEEVDPELNVF